MGFALIARAVATGVVATAVLRYGVGVPVSALLRNLAIGHPFARVVLASWAPAAFAAAVWIASGWIVSRTGRTAVPYAIAILVWNLPRTYDVVANATADVRYVPALIAHGMNVITAMAGILIGGWLATCGRPRIPERVTPVL